MAVRFNSNTDNIEKTNSDLTEELIRKDFIFFKIARLRALSSLLAWQPFAWEHQWMRPERRASQLMV